MSLPKKPIDITDITNETMEMTLIRESIDKWENIAAGLANDQGMQDCPLCQEYHQHSYGSDRHECGNCPLHVQGEEFYCFTENGVYQEFTNYYKHYLLFHTFNTNDYETKQHEIRKDTGYQEKAQSMVDMLEYMYQLYSIKQVHDGT